MEHPCISLTGQINHRKMSPSCRMTKGLASGSCEDGGVRWEGFAGAARGHGSCDEENSVSVWREERCEGQ